MSLLKNVNRNIIALFFFILLSSQNFAAQTSCFLQDTWDDELEMEKLNEVLDARTLPNLAFETTHPGPSNSIQKMVKERYEVVMKQFQSIDREKVVADCHKIMRTVAISLARCLLNTGKKRLETTIMLLDDLKNSLPNTPEYNSFRDSLVATQKRFNDNLQSPKLNVRADSERGALRHANGLEDYDGNIHRTYYNVTFGTIKSFLGEMKVCAGLNPSRSLCGIKSNDLVSILFERTKSKIDPSKHLEWRQFIQDTFLNQGQALAGKEFDAIEFTLDGKIIIQEVKTPEELTTNWENKIKNLNDQYDLTDKIVSKFNDPQTWAKFGCCRMEQHLNITDGFTPQGLITILHPTTPPAIPVKYRVIRTNFN